MRKYVDCGQCKFHYWDWFVGDYDEFEVCDKGKDLYPDECDDFEEL